jgi:hypothetical protein
MGGAYGRRAGRGRGIVIAGLATLMHRFMSVEGDPLPMRHLAHMNAFAAPLAIGEIGTAATAAAKSSVSVCHLSRIVLHRVYECWFALGIARCRQLHFALIPKLYGVSLRSEVALNNNIWTDASKVRIVWCPAEARYGEFHRQPRRITPGRGQRGPVHGELAFMRRWAVQTTRGNGFENGNFPGRLHEGLGRPLSLRACRRITLGVRERVVVIFEQLQATGMLFPGQFNTAEQGEQFGSCLPIQRRTSCCPFGSRRLLTPSPSNRSGRETGLSRPRRKQPSR